MNLSRAMIFIFSIPILLPGYAYAQQSVDVPTGFIEDGKQISLEMVVYKPVGFGNGPFPTLVFNHGSAGIFKSPDALLITSIHVPVANYFNSKGWLVVFPQRRGRGKSGGTYGEGLTESRSRYSISPKKSLPGIDRALNDIDAVVNYLQTEPMVNADEMIIGGQSRGGLLAIVYAGTRPGAFKGAINFSGCWIGSFTGSGFIRVFYDYMEKINTPSFTRGAELNKSTIWFYGEDDKRCNLEHSKSNFDAFIDAGGTGSFHSYSREDGIDGHFVSYYPELWIADLDAYLEKLE